jgi:NAD+ kinase
VADGKRLPHDVVTLPNVAMSCPGRPMIATKQIRHRDGFTASANNHRRPKSFRPFSAGFSAAASAILRAAVACERRPVTDLMDFRTLAIVAAEHDEARQAAGRLQTRYANVPPEEADVIVALGGDGFMLETLHRFMARRVPIFGMNRGSVGFLMNAYRENDLLQRLSKAELIELNPLRMSARDRAGTTHEALAINEVSLLRQSRLAAKLRIEIDGVIRMPEMISDGVLVATPAGSTAYNVSVNGPILPLGAHVLTLTPISVFRPRHWRGAILPHQVTITIQVLFPDVRPVSAVADYTEVRTVDRVVVREDRNLVLKLLFDPEHNLEERIIKEQFLL